MARSCLRILLRVSSLAILAVLGAMLAASAAHAASPPAGVTGFGSSARVELAWQPSAGASAYAVYRGTSATTVTARVSPAGGVLGTSFSDATAANGTTYFYAVRAIESGFESASSAIVSATPAARACSTGNPTVLENCLPGSSGWPLRSAATVSTGGIEGYATAQSINHGESVGLKVSAAAGSAYDIEVYRMGSYGGLGARLVTTLRNLRDRPARVPVQRVHRALRLLELVAQRDAQHDRGVAERHVPAAARARGQRLRRAHPPHGRSEERRVGKECR